MEILTQLAWAVTPGILTGIVLAVWNKSRRSGRKSRTGRRSSGSRASRCASPFDGRIKLSYAVAMAASRGYPNGEIEEGSSNTRGHGGVQKFERDLVAEHSAQP